MNELSFKTEFNKILNQTEKKKKRQNSGKLKHFKNNL